MRAVALFAGVGLFLWTAEALALERPHFEGAALVGSGTNPTDGPINPLLVDLGGRAGASWAGFYGGARLLYSLGGYVDGGSNLGTSVHALQIAGEGGYGVLLADVLTLRATLGIGDLVVTLPAQIGGAPATSGHLFLQPTATAALAFGLLLVGGEVGLLVSPDGRITGTSESMKPAAIAHLEVGVRF